MSTVLGKGILAGAIQGAAAAVALFNYTHTGELGTSGWVSCLIFMGTFLYIGILKSIDKKVRDKIGVLVTSNAIISTFIIQKELVDEFSKFASEMGMDAHVEKVPTDEM